MHHNNNHNSIIIRNVSLIAKAFIWYEVQLLIFVWVLYKILHKVDCIQPVLQNWWRTCSTPFSSKSSSSYFIPSPFIFFIWTLHTTTNLHFVYSDYTHTLLFLFFFIFSLIFFILNEMCLSPGLSIILS